MKFKTSSLLMFLCTMLLPVYAAHADTLYQLKMTYEVRPDTTLDEWIPVDEAELSLSPGMTGSAFVGDAGITIAVATAGEMQYLVDFLLTTLPPSAKVVSKQILLDRKRNIEIGGLLYKRSMPSRVMVSIRDLEGEISCDFGSVTGARSVDEFVSDIPFHGAPSMIDDTLGMLNEQMWYSDPSAHFELYFIPNTLGDFAWNVLRDFVEQEFQVFDNVFGLNRSQKTHYFLSPCKVPEIAWYPNRSWAVNPTTFKAYALFNRTEKLVSGVPTNINHLYRYRGYAPLSLVEGAARGFEYDHYYAKKLNWRGALPRPSEWWPTIKYKSYPDTGLYIAASSFVSYLIGTQGTSKFYQLYDIVHDLNPDSAFSAVYGKPFRTIEDGWLNFLDTMKVYPHIASYFISRAKVLGRNQESIELLSVLVDVDSADVSKSRDELALLYFLEGEFDHVVETISSMPDVYRNADRIIQMGNSSLFFGGHVDSARAGFSKHRADSLSGIMQSAVCLLSGWLERTEGNFELADSLFGLTDSTLAATRVDQVEIALHRGFMRRLQGKHEQADLQFRKALRETMALLVDRSGAGDLYLRAGEAYAGLGHSDTALTYLDVAEFLEYRPYYIGRILVAMGNAYDLLGMRDRALYYYQRVIDENTSYPARTEARKYILDPYKVNRAG
jgi:tetratricopeptide (TPR) repeat protein